MRKKLNINRAGKYDSRYFKVACARLRLCEFFFCLITEYIVAVYKVAEFVKPLSAFHLISSPFPTTKGQNPVFAHKNPPRHPSPFCLLPLPIRTQNDAVILTSCICVTHQALFLPLYGGVPKHNRSRLKVPLRWSHILGQTLHAPGRNPDKNR